MGCQSGDDFAMAETHGRIQDPKPIICVILIRGMGGKRSVAIVRNASCAC
jgi:hypothetical protein